MNDDTTDDFEEEQIREIAREEARNIYELEVEDDETGEKWSIRRFIRDFKLSRREALQAVGLVALGVGAREAVAQILIGDAQAAAQDNLNVPGTVDAGAANVDDLTVTNDGDGSGIGADSVDGYDIQKDGTDGSGVINFKTS